MKLKLLLCAALAFFAFGASAQSQTPVVVQCSVNNPTNPWAPCSSGNPLPVSASVTASVAPFLPSASGSRGTQFTVNTTTTSQTLPTGAAVVVSNVGTTNTMYCNAVGVAATTSDEPITPNGGWFVFGTANAGGSINCIASGGTTTANMVGGGGLPAGTGGGSGGSGGTVNQGTGGASAWLVTGTGGTFPIVTWGGGTLGAMANYGTSPGAVLVPGVNAFVTNSNANGAAAPASSSPVTPSNQPVGAATINMNQISVASTATQIVAARTGVSGTGRVSVTICNTGTTAVYIGTSSVTTSNGSLLPGIVGACLTLNTTAQVEGIVATGTETVSFIETF